MNVQKWSGFFGPPCKGCFFRLNFILNYIPIITITNNSQGQYPVRSRRHRRCCHGDLLVNPIKMMMLMMTMLIMLLIMTLIAGVSSLRLECISSATTQTDCTNTPMHFNTLHTSLFIRNTEIFI